MSKQSAPNILENNIVESEINHLRNIDAFMQLAVTHIDKISDNSIFLEKDEDLDHTPFEPFELEFSYFDLRVWIDFKLYNDYYDITDVCVKNNDDIDYTYLANWLKADLVSYYNKETIARSYSYKQALEIKQEQNDPHDLRPNEKLGFEVNKKHLEILQSICDEKEAKLSMFLKHGYAGCKLKLKRNINCTDLVKTVLPLVNKNIFEQVSLLSDKKEVATFIYDNFKRSKGVLFNVRTIQNIISDQFLAS